MLQAAVRQCRLKSWQQIALSLALLYFLFLHLLPAVRTHYDRSHLQHLPTDVLDPRKHGPIYKHPSDLTTNLIVATTAKDNITWTSQLIPHLPNLKIYRYVSDSPTAPFHPPIPKGREALMYHTFLRDFHNATRTPGSNDDGLADINIFTHAGPTPWHGDNALLRSMPFMLAHLDLQHVLKHGYVNLRTSWIPAGEHDCPDGGFNTSKTIEESPQGEEAYMRGAFEVNFPAEEVPEMFAGPCCSQFAVTRETIRSRKVEVYERTVGWLVETSWPDQLAGRVWEHMWIWLFKGISKDCGNGYWRTLCARYGVCFENDMALTRYEKLWAEAEKLRDRIGFWRNLLRPARVERAKNRVHVIGDELNELLIDAVARGSDGDVRTAAEIEQTVESLGQG